MEKTFSRYSTRICFGTIILSNIYKLLTSLCKIFADDASLFPKAIRGRSISTYRENWVFWLPQPPYVAACNTWFDTPPSPPPPHFFLLRNVFLETPNESSITSFKQKKTLRLIFN